MLSFCGLYGYNYFKQWEANRFSEMAMLKSNQELFLKKVTDLSTTITHIVNDTIKSTTVVKPDNTYVELKEQVIELKKDETANKDEIAKLREELSAQRKAFLASDDTILIKTVDDTLLLYRDTEGNLQPASKGIEKIIEHKEVSDVPILAEDVNLDKTNWNIKAGGYYSFDKEYGIIISKEILSIKKYSLNASLLIADIQDYEFSVGGNINYELTDNLELGIGYDTSKNYFVLLQYQF